VAPGAAVRTILERHRAPVAIALGLLSLLLTAAGLLAVIAFDSAAGDDGAVPERWPVSTRLTRSSARGQLLLFAHPYCGCTKATLAELARLIASEPRESLPAITVVTLRPSSDSKWSWDDLRKTAAVPGAAWVWDDAGREARRFGATTSGLVLLYGRSGRLAFRGGITGSRGHEGDNYGLDALRTALGEEPAVRTFATSDQNRPARGRVFGCSLALAEPAQE
jgi:hypothetical protein